MNEDFVPFELAKKLKEKGFRYNKENRLDRIFMAEGINHPTISQVLKWLRENRFILVINPTLFNADCICVGWQCEVWADDNYNSLSKEHKTYEAAAIDGIEYVLDNLI